MNFKEETIKAVEEANKTERDIKFIAFKRGLEKGGRYDVIEVLSWSYLDFEYETDDYYANDGVHISAVVVFKDGTWLSRNEHNDATSWIYNSLPTVDSFVK